MPPWHSLVLRGIANPVSRKGYPGSNPGGGVYVLQHVCVFVTEFEHAQKIKIVRFKNKQPLI